MLLGHDDTPLRSPPPPLLPQPPLRLQLPSLSSPSTYHGIPQDSIEPASPRPRPPLHTVIKREYIYRQFIGPKAAICFKGADKDYSTTDMSRINLQGSKTLGYGMLRDHLYQ